MIITAPNKLNLNIVSDMISKPSPSVFNFVHNVCALKSSVVQLMTIPLKNISFTLAVKKGCSGLNKAFNAPLTNDNKPGLFNSTANAII